MALRSVKAASLHVGGIRHHPSAEAKLRFINCLDPEEPAAQSSEVVDVWPGLTFSFAPQF
jgi:hypothetical protein